jgi:hypothetical protein
MNVILWGFTLLLIAGIAVLAIVIFIGVVALLVESIVEYIEARLSIVTIGDDEEALIAEAEKVREERRRAFKGPWALTPQLEPYNSKVFRFHRAKETLEKKQGKDS